MVTKARFGSLVSLSADDKGLSSKMTHPKTVGFECFILGIENLSPFQFETGAQTTVRLGSGRSDTSRVRLPIGAFSSPHRFSTISRTSPFRSQASSHRVPILAFRSPASGRRPPGRLGLSRWLWRRWATAEGLRQGQEDHRCEGRESKAAAAARSRRRHLKAFARRTYQ
jgi:hypothetical protein